MTTTTSAAPPRSWQRPAKSTTRAARGEPLRWLEATLAELQANPSDGCVIWPFGNTEMRYAQVWIDGRPKTASRFVLERTVGPAPAGMEACHAPIVCHNRACVNPVHLRWDTLRNNRLDMLLDGTQRRSKLTARDAWEVRQLWASGEWTRPQLAAEFGVTRSAISHIINGVTWTHIEGVPRPSERDHVLRHP